MSNISDNDIDKLFKEAAENYQTSFDESAWEDMERRMGDKGDDGFSYFKIIGGIIAVLMLGSILIWNGSSEKTNSNSDLNNVDEIAQATEESLVDFNAGENNFSALKNPETSPSENKNNTFDKNASQAYLKGETDDGFTSSERDVVESQVPDNASQLSETHVKPDNSSASNYQKGASKNSLPHVGEGATIDTINNTEGSRVTNTQKALLHSLNSESDRAREIENKENTEDRGYERLISEKVKSTDPSADKEEQLTDLDISLKNEREEQHKEDLKLIEDNALTTDNNSQEPDDESGLPVNTNKEEDKNGSTSISAMKTGGGEINEDNADDDNVNGFVVLEGEKSDKNSENSPFTGVYSPMMLLDRLGYLDYQYPVGEGQLNKVEITEASAEADRYVNSRAFALKFAYSPDLTSIGYFKPDKPGSNFGIMGSYFIGRWSVSTGAIYSRKIYFTEESASYGYYSSRSDYSRIDGDCRVIDIPINISYYLSKNINHSFYLSAGSSSYIMLKENYEYLSITNGTEKEWSQEVSNENNHFFGVLNLSIGYERRVKNNVFIQLEPFVKAPIAGIGEGKVDLVSTGAFLNLVYQFNRK